MKLKEFIEESIKHGSMISAMQLGGKLIELQAITNYINLLYGVELEIEVKPAERKQNDFYGRGLIDNIIRENEKQGNVRNM